MQVIVSVDCFCCSSAFKTWYEVALYRLNRELRWFWFSCTGSCYLPFEALSLVTLKEYSRDLVLHFHKVGCLTGDAFTKRQKYPDCKVDLTVPIMQLSRVFHQMLLFWADSFDLTCFHLPSTVDEGGGDGNPDPDRGPQSVCPSQHRPQRSAAEEEQSESIPSLLLVCTVACKVEHFSHLHLSSELFWPQFQISQKSLLTLPDDIIVHFDLSQIRQQNQFDMMSSGPRSQHLAGIPVDEPRRVRHFSSD